MPDQVPNPAAAQIVTPPPPSLQQQAANITPPNAPVPAAMSAPISLPQGSPTPLPQPPQPKVQGPGPWHRAVQALLGSTTEYKQTPQGPVPIQVENKPGTLFRSILAGAILGAGAGASNSQNDAGSGWAAAGRGAAAAQQGQQQQQQQRAADAQKQWENQRQANQDSQEEIARKAQTALNNVQTMRLVKETQGLDYDDHMKVVNTGKASAKDFDSVGVHPLAEDIPESQMAQWVQDHPGTSAQDGIVTGVKLDTTKDADGNDVPHYEYTFSIYDHNAKVPVSPATYDEWKKDGLFDRHPEYADILKNGKVLPALQYGHIKAEAEGILADNFAKQTQDLGIKKDQAAIDADNARRSESLANTHKINQETADAALGKTQSEQFDKALQELNSKGGNFDALQPSSRVVLAESMDKMVPALTAEYKDILASDDPDAQAKAGDVLSQIQNLTSLGTRALGSINGGGSAGAIPYVDPDNPTVKYNIPPDQVDAFLKLHPKATKIGGASPPTGNQDEKVLVQTPTGTGIMTRGEYEQAVANPAPGRSIASYGKIIGPAPAAAPPTIPDLTKGNSY